MHCFKPAQHTGSSDTDKQGGCWSGRGGGGGRGGRRRGVGTGKEGAGRGVYRLTNIMICIMHGYGVYLILLH